MLSLRNIVKDYSTGSNRVRALNGISLEFRESEFVSILGPSGCGKTTLLNIIGGLDQYTSGDLIINEVSTKQYNDADWDTYRNHSIGFVFQNYNLIPHQTVLANVELALTLSGVSKRERRRRAIDALKMVGLSTQIHKKPTQMSGGQMQRVAIARALVNNPDILLADEPTGALDTKTSEQIMEILHQIAKTKLVIMVTHNPDLAYRYSNRIITLVDGRLTSDSNPYRAEKVSSTKLTMQEYKDLIWKRTAKKSRNPFAIQKKDLEKANLKESKTRSEQKKTKRSMSFFTALSLSFNNLLTKKGRTFMTSFAGSIGIIGIALILSVSTGVNNYINSVQRDTLASYPIQLEAETEDLSSLISTIMGNNKDDKYQHELDKVYESAIIADLFNSFNSIESSSNDLKSFKAHLESTEEFRDYLSAVQYGYHFNWSILTKDEEGNVVESDVMKLFEAMSGMSGASSMMDPSTNMMMSSGFDIWQEMLQGTDGELINELIKDQYDLIYGQWPQKYNEVLLVVDENNEISDLSLYALGLRTEKEIKDDLMTSMGGGLLDTEIPDSWTYEEICGMTFRLMLASETYQKQANGIFADMTMTKAGMEYLYNNTKIGTDLRVVGIIRPGEEASSAILTGTIAYTSALSDYALNKTRQSELLKAQLDQPTIDVLTGLPFATKENSTPTPEEIRQEVTEYMSTVSVEKKAEIYTAFLCTPSTEQTEAFVEQQLSAMKAEDICELLIFALSTQIELSPEELASYIDNMDSETQLEYAKEILAAAFAEQYAAQVQAGIRDLTPTQLAAMYDLAATQFTQENYNYFYENHLPKKVSDATYEDNLLLLGYVREESPDFIYLYASNFENKDAIADLIADYNNSVDEEQQIAYTDYVAILMSSITTIVNAISYVLIAFVAISLVVSSIMIGIITYISVLERTKEIGILRAIGASKRDIRRVFNAETLLIGFVAGAIGILATLGLNIVINMILFHFTKIPNLQASLPVVGAVVLVVISMLLTLIAGLFPAGIAAKKNPVEALRSE